ncbi:MAG: MBL fold metallo-hydrolase [Bacillota bacterium]|nr:MBL fold metallo-hydrolase [Bacillota bacterium]
MKLSFYGADREVTGSCHCIDINGKRILIDCGLFQGHGEENNKFFAFDPEKIDYVIITHAHIDHSGRLPMLVKQGFKGKIYATRATCHLLSIMLRDSAHIQEMDVQWKNKKSKRAGKEPDVPLYTIEDAEKCLKHLIPCKYDEDLSIWDGVMIKFTDAGHLLGSSSVSMSLTEKGISKLIVFSGDIGNTDQPIIRDPSYLTDADYVVMESTYGDRDHETEKNYTVGLANIINQTLSRGGNVVIPSFAVGRTQELLYYFREIKEQRLVYANPDFPVYVDSPLASEATKIYDSDLLDNADEQSIEIIKSGFDPIKFSNLHLCETEEESISLNEDITPKVIVSSSGMCEAGRIRHHLKHNLWRKECSVVFVGFQADGTLGRKIVEGAQSVHLFGEDISIAAEIHNFRGLSAHADRTGLIKWISSFNPKPEKVFIVHGENTSCDVFSNTLHEMGFDTFIPKFETSYDLLSDKLLSEGIDMPNVKHADHASTSFSRLHAAGMRLLDVIEHNSGGSNKDLAKFTDQIIELCRKWDR